MRTGSPGTVLVVIRGNSGSAGHHVILEGILAASRYGPMLEALRRDRLGTTRLCYLDVSWEETARRILGDAGLPIGPPPV
ncbi:hypothetical protein HTZ77_21930 [Nonomuraea sp. SMC257]|uniref:Uncharacterized protein n=1 Tax=Nonomuraea montanisoli TaxID=2741721 RepID=A0A7Y6I9B8_9ACTN|nr:hypothetical protein [Nonomuraea montanisoli]NUW34072.1 hypothetical protein [Nonomuraea montanisoli]